MQPGAGTRPLPSPAMRGRAAVLNHGGGKEKGKKGKKGKGEKGKKGQGGGAGCSRHCYVSAAPPGRGQRQRRAGGGGAAAPLP